MKKFLILIGILTALTTYNVANREPEYNESIAKYKSYDEWRKQCITLFLLACGMSIGLGIFVPIALNGLIEHVEKRDKNGKTRK